MDNNDYAIHLLGSRMTEKSDTTHWKYGQNKVFFDIFEKKLQMQPSCIDYFLYLSRIDIVQQKNKRRNITIYKPLKSINHEKDFFYSVLAIKREHVLGTVSNPIA